VTPDCDGVARNCSCAHESDGFGVEEDCDGVVDTDELRGYLDLWFLGEVSMGELLSAVNVWLS